MNEDFSDNSFDAARRRFVQGLALGGAAMALGGGKASRTADGTAGQAVLAGDEFDLEIGALPVNFTGKSRIAQAINGRFPGPILRWREGSTVTLRVTNRLREPSSIHWHGILLPAGMDGVPGISFPGIAPGETFTYRFPVKQGGTYWYHSHSRFQEQNGPFGALVIEPANGERHPCERDYVVMLNDWTDLDPSHIFALLKKQGDYFNRNEPTLPEFLRDASMLGMRGALHERAMWNRMRMNPRDLIDVGGFTYTYLTNGATPAGNWTGLYRPGERVRLRFINASASSYFDVRIPGLKMRVISADGQDVHPVEVDEFRIAVAETCDVIVQPQEDRAYTIFAQSFDRSGYARGTLATRAGMEAEVPVMDPVPTLAMTDMMGAMASGAHGMPQNGMAGMVEAQHARSEYRNPGVDMRVDRPRGNLDDPGVGLRGNGRRVLAYADLRALDPPPDPRQPDREIELHLTGNMRRFVWSFDGVKFSDAKPVHFRYGERLRIVLVNDTMMNHPIHLHGMFSDLENERGEVIARKHTVNVQPAQRIAYRVSADSPGRWAYHCHLLYHMEAGMFREVVVA
ncbi:MAG: copper resistance system multicopper oxidase [Proteobacteria bacterium]|nr:copper resistance system multicopper oxidase [Pseudomonadota bacterium]